MPDSVYFSTTALSLLMLLVNDWQ